MKIGLIRLIQEEKHKAPPGHPENAERLKAALEYILSSDIAPDLADLTAGKVDPAVIYEVHSDEYIKSLEASARSGDSYIDGETYLTAGSYEAAMEAASAAIWSVDTIFDGGRKRIFLAARPPGHHAEYSRGMGFCIINNTAVAAQQAIRRYGVKRLAIIDWDVHHGNGTQHIFYTRPDVYYISIHRFPFYPGSGSTAERGVAEGAGYTLNIPLPAAAGNDMYLAAFRERIIPQLEQYKPEFIIITAGFDAHISDPLGGMALTEEAFGSMTEQLVRLSEKYCQGRILSLFEGGYSAQGNAVSIYRHLKELRQD